MFNNLSEKIKGFFLVNTKVRITAVVILAVLLGVMIYFGFFYKNPTYDVGLTDKQVRALKDREKSKIEAQYRIDEKALGQQLLIEKIDCINKASASDMREYATKKNKIVSGIQLDKSLNDEQKSQKIADALGVLAKEYETKEAAFQRECDKQYKNSFGTKMNDLEKEKKIRLNFINDNPVSITEGGDGSQTGTQDVSGNSAAEKMLQLRDFLLNNSAPNPKISPPVMPPSSDEIPGRSGGFPAP